MRVILEIDLDTERNVYDDLLALRKHYNRGSKPATLMGRKLTPAEQDLFGCDRSSPLVESNAQAVLEKWEEEAEKEEKLKSVLEEFIAHICTHGFEEAYCAKCDVYFDADICKEILEKFRELLKKRKVDVKIKGLDVED